MGQVRNMEKSGGQPAPASRVGLGFGICSACALVLSQFVTEPLCVQGKDVATWFLDVAVCLPYRVRFFSFPVCQQFPMSDSFMCLQGMHFAGSHNIGGSLWCVIDCDRVFVADYCRSCLESVREG